jgi:Xaa-Pro aminopeptidase
MVKTKQAIIKRREKLMKHLKPGTLALLFSGRAPYRSADAKYPFHVNRNFYYLTGIDRENFVLYLYKSPKGEICEQIFLEELNPEMEKWTGFRMKPEEAIAISGIEKTGFVSDLQNQVFRLMAGFQVASLALDLERPSWEFAGYEAHRFLENVQPKYPQMPLYDLAPYFAERRMIKDEVEIQALRKAIAITEKGLDRVLDRLVPGFMEYEVQAAFESTVMENGSCPAFSTIAVGGKNAVVLHYEENNRRLNDGECILLDLGADWSNYSADISRTYPVNGRFSERQRAVYEAVLDTLKTVTAAVKPGKTLMNLQNLSKEILGRHLKAMGLIEKEEEIIKYYYHGIGHHLGLDTHDASLRGLELKPGMVITVEPGLYIKEWEIGIRIEDDVLVTETGFEVLSASIIREADEVEARMNHNSMS